MKNINKKNLQNLFSILKFPIITDKATRLLEFNKYSFMVDSKANKFTIKKIVEYLFNVNVLKVNILHLPNKKKTIGRFSGYKSNYKKAILTLKSGDNINLFPNL